MAVLPQEIDYDPERMSTGRELYDRWTATCADALLLLGHAVHTARKQKDNWELRTLRYTRLNVSGIRSAVQERRSLPTSHGWLLWGLDAAPGIWEQPYQVSTEAVVRVGKLFDTGIGEFRWDWKRYGFLPDWPGKPDDGYPGKRLHFYPRAKSSDPRVLDRNSERAGGTSPLTGAELRARWDTICWQAYALLKGEERFASGIAKQDGPGSDKEIIDLKVSAAAATVAEIWQHVNATTLLPTSELPPFRLADWEPGDGSSYPADASDAANRVRDLFLNGLDEPGWDWQKDGFPPDWPTTATDIRNAGRATRHSERIMRKKAHAPRSEYNTGIGRSAP